MKEVSTVVDDIYKLLEPLCSGESIDIPNDAIEDLGENIKDVC